MPAKITVAGLVAVLAGFAVAAPVGNQEARADADVVVSPPLASAIASADPGGFKIGRRQTPDGFNLTPEQIAALEGLGPALPPVEKRQSLLDLTPEQIQALEAAAAASGGPNPPWLEGIGKRQSLSDLTPEQIQAIEAALAATGGPNPPWLEGIDKRQSLSDLTPEQIQAIEAAAAASGGPNPPWLEGIDKRQPQPVLTPEQAAAIAGAPPPQGVPILPKDVASEKRQTPPVPPQIQVLEDNARFGDGLIPDKRQYLPGLTPEQIQAIEEATAASGGP